MSLLLFLAHFRGFDGFDLFGIVFLGCDLVIVEAERNPLIIIIIIPTAVSVVVIAGRAGSADEPNGVPGQAKAVPADSASAAQLAHLHPAEPPGRNGVAAPVRLVQVAKRVSVEIIRQTIAGLKMNILT